MKGYEMALATGMDFLAAVLAPEGAFSEDCLREFGMSAMEWDGIGVRRKKAFKPWIFVVPANKFGWHDSYCVLQDRHGGERQIKQHKVL